MRLASFLMVAAALAFASCSSSPSGPAPMRLDSLVYELEPGQEEYYCYAFTLPADRETVITAFRPDYGPGTHHIFFGYTLAPEPEGFSPCPVLARDTWVPLYLGGQYSTELEMPEGAAVRLPPGTQVFFQLHLQNPTPDAISAQTAMELDLADPAENLVPAGVFGLDDREVLIPARATGVTAQLTGCRPNRTMDVFAVLGHMHNYGTRLEVFRGAPDTGEMLFDQEWSFAEQPTTPVGFSISPTDEVSLRCTFDNPTNADLTWGESSTNEMCAFIFYYTPFDYVDGCIEGGQ